MANASLDLHNRGLFQHAVPPPYGYLGAEELRELMSHRAGDHIRISGRPDWTNLGLTFRDYLDARSMLPTSAELISLPPDGSLDDLRRTAEERIWTLAEPFLAKQLSVATIQAWSEELARVSPGSEAALAPYLSDPALLLQNLRIGHFEEVADATIVNTPEIFRSLFVLASELQMAQYALMRRWLALEHPSDAEFSRGEKALLSKFGSAMKDFNGGHLTQSHLTKDFTGPQMRDFAGKDDEWSHVAKGMDYLFYDKSTDRVASLAGVFPAEMRAIRERFHGIAQHVRHALSSGAGASVALPADRGYEELADFLDLFAEFYGDLSTDPAIIGVRVDEIKRYYATLRAKGCRMYPIIGNNPDNLSYWADVEYRLAVVTREAMANQALVDGVRRRIESDVLPEFAGRLDDRYVEGIVALDVTSIFWAAGPNNYWRTRGESIEGLQLTHHDAVGEVSRLREIPALHRMFHLDGIDHDAYHRGSTVDTSVHEIWHQFGSTDDSDLMARLVDRDGNSKESILALAEFKSEAGTARGVLAAREELAASGLDMRTMLLVRLGAMCDALRFKGTEAGTSGARYHYAQVAILGRLMDAGLVRSEGDRYRLDDDTEASLLSIADLARELESLFLDDTHAPGSVDAFVAATRERADRADMRDFMAKLREEA